MNTKIRNDWNGNDFDIISINDFVKRINDAKLPTYEVINDVLRYNFDVDCYCIKDEFDNELALTFETQCYTYIYDALEKYTNVAPIIITATSHSKNYDEKQGKYSVRFYVTNMKDTRENMKSFVKNLNISISNMPQEVLRDCIEIKDNKYFDESIYSNLKKLRCINTSKPNENRPLILKNGNIEDTIVNNIENCIDVNYSDPNIKINIPNSPSPNSVTSVFQKIGAINKETANQKLQKLAFFVENGFDNPCKNDHLTFTKLGYAIASEFKEEGLDLYLQLASSYTSQTEFKQEYEEKYKYFINNNNHKCKLGTIYWIFKKHNEKLYVKLSKEWNLNNNHLDLINNILSTGIIADYFKELYGDFVITSNEKTYMFNGIYWKLCNKENTELKQFVDKVFYKDLIEYGQHKMNELTKLLYSAADKDEASIINGKIKEVTKYLHFCKSLKHSNMRKAYISDIITFTTDDTIEFNLNPYLFAFENKIWDLENESWVEPEPSQYISKTTGYAYIENNDPKLKTDLETLLSSIFPDPDIKNYYLTYLSTGLSGIQMEEFMIATGIGGNGKSLINGLMMNLVGSYGYEVPSSVFSSEIKLGPNAELYNLNNVRFALTAEPDAKKKFTCSTIKSITGNPSIAVRDLHSSKVGIRLNLTLLCEANDVPDFDEINQAVNRRVRATIFEAVAIDKSDYDRLDEEDKKKYIIKNPYFKTTEFKEKYRQTFFNILTEYFTKFKKNNYVLQEMPKKCKSKVVNLLASSDGIYSWFEDIYEKDESAEPIKLSDIYSKFSASSYYMKLNKSDQRSLNKKRFLEKITTSIFLQKYIKMRKQYYKNMRLDTDCIIGWKIKPVEQDTKLDDENVE